MNAAYEEFLKSEVWKSLRETRMKYDEDTCVICGARNELQCHHLSYEDVEDIAMLRTVCKKCHRDIHEFAKEVKESSRNGKLKACMDAYNDAMAEIMDSFFVGREATLNKDGDAYMLTKGHHERANKYIRALFDWQPYGPLINYGQRPYCGIGHKRYNEMRLNHGHDHHDPH